MQDVVTKQDSLRESTKKAAMRETGAASTSGENFSWDGVRGDPEMLNAISNSGPKQCIYLPSSSESDEHSSLEVPQNIRDIVARPHVTLPNSQSMESFQASWWSQASTM